MVATAAITADYEAPPKPPVDVEFLVLGSHALGWTNRAIAEELDLAESTVSDWINRAYDRGYFDHLPHPKEFGLRTECRCERDPIGNGVAIVCVSCAASGFDFHPRMNARPLPPERKHRPGKLKGGT